MTNEMKLLMALCDALGFEVEVEYEQDREAYDIALKNHYHSNALSNNSFTWQIKNPFPYTIDDFKKPVGYNLKKKSPN